MHLIEGVWRSYANHVFSEFAVKAENTSFSFDICQGWKLASIVCLIKSLKVIFFSCEQLSESEWTYGKLEVSRVGAEWVSPGENRQSIYNNES